MRLKKSAKKKQEQLPSAPLIKDTKAVAGTSAHSSPPVTGPKPIQEVVPQVNSVQSTAEKVQIVPTSAPLIGGSMPAKSVLATPSPPNPVTTSASIQTTKPAQTIAAPNGDGLPSDPTDNPDTDRAVDYIISEEADEVLEAEDAKLEEKNYRSHGFGDSLADFFFAWLGNKYGWRWTLLVILIILAALGTVPKIRYWALNEAGVRSSLSITVTDVDTTLPLQNVTASVTSSRGETDRNGDITIKGLRLGPSQLILKRPGFAQRKISIIVGWGENPLGSFTLKDVGQQYTIMVRDYITGKPVVNAEAADTNGFDALSDKNGKITLTIDNPNNQSVPITLTAAGYRTEDLTLSGDSSIITSSQLVIAKKEIFILDQGGGYNLTTKDIDGQNQQLLLAGTPTETSNLSMAVSPDGSRVALVSLRDSKYDSSGRLLTAITLVNVSDGSTTDLDHAEQIQLIGWTNTSIVYEEETTLSPASYSIVSYNYANNSRDLLASSAQFNSIFVAGGAVYYSVPATASTSADGFFILQPNGSGKHAILSQDIWTVLRNSYTTMSIQTSSGWYSYKIGDATANTENTPSSFDNRLYIDSPDGKHSAWVSTSAGKNQLMVYSTSNGKDTDLISQAGLSYPIRWLDNSTLVYRVTNLQGSFDYIVSLNGGTTKKIADVINVSGYAAGS
jgi:hypothetical protein